MLKSDYKPTENDKKVVTDWLLQELGEEAQEGFFIYGYIPFDWEESLELMNKYAAWNIREFCKDLSSMIEQFEQSDAYSQGISVSDWFEDRIINKFK